MFGRKRKKKLFGTEIEPNCAYCRHNGGKGAVFCTLRLQIENGKCKKFLYDPLLREPKSSPPLRGEKFSEEDFKL